MSGNLRLPTSVQRKQIPSSVPPSSILIAADDDKSLTTKTLEIEGVGRNAEFGELFDSKTGKFLGIHCFNGKLPSEFLNQTDIPRTETTFSIIRSTKDKVYHLDIAADLCLDILSGQIKVEASAAYLNDLQESSNRVEGILQYKERTVRETLNLSYSSMRERINFGVLNESDATHIVIAIEYGGNALFKFLDKEERKDEKTKLDGSLKMEADFKKIQMKTAAEGHYDDLTKSTDSTFDITIFGDITLEGQIPQKIEDVLEIIRTLPGTIRKSNGGKGKALHYTLYPIESLKALWKLELKQTQMAVELELSILDDLLIIFDLISISRQQLNDFEQNLLAHTECTLDKDLTSISDFKHNFHSETMTFKEKVKEGMHQVRSGQAESSILKDIKDKYHDGEFSLKKVQEFLRSPEFFRALEKISRYQTYRKHGVAYFGREAGSHLEAFRCEHSDKITYVLYYSPTLVKLDPRAMEDNQDIFLVKLAQPFSKLAVVDCDFEESHAAAASGPEPELKDGGQSGRLTRTVIRQYHWNSCIDLSTDMMNKKNEDKLPSLKVAALGRYRKIGDMYDARTDRFIGLSILQPTKTKSEKNPEKKMAGEKILLKARPSKIFPHSTSELMKELRIEPDQACSVLCQNFPLEGGLGPVLDNNNSLEIPSTALVQSLLLSHTVRKQELFESDKNLENLFQNLNVSSLFDRTATHFVQAVEFGESSLISLLYKNKDGDADSAGSSELSFQINKKMREDLRFLKNIIDSRLYYKEPPKQQAGLPTNSSDDTTTFFQRISKDYSVRISSDLYDNPIAGFMDGDVLQDFTNKYCTTIQQENGRDWAKPISYLLYPIGNLDPYFGNLPKLLPFGAVSSSSSLKNLEFPRIFDVITEGERRLQELQEIIEDNEDLIPELIRSKFVEFSQSFSDKIENFRGKFKEILLAIKKGGENEKELMELKQTFKNDAGLFNCPKTLELAGFHEFDSHLKKIRFAAKIRNERPEILWLGRKQLLEQQLEESRHREKFIFVLFVDWSQEGGEMDLNSSSWSQLYGQLFSSVLYGKPFNRLILFDCEMLSKKDHTAFCSSSCSHPRIHQYLNGTLINKDVFSTWHQEVRNLKRDVPLTLQAIGFSHADLGQLYNAHEDRFTGDSVLKYHYQSGNPKFIERQNLLPKFASSAHTCLKPGSSQVKILEALDVSPGQSVDILAGNLNLPKMGVGKYFSMEMQTEVDCDLSIFTGVGVKTERLNLKEPTLIPQLNGLSLYEETGKGATHFVREVRRGHSAVIISWQTSNKENLDSSHPDPEEVNDNETKCDRKRSNHLCQFSSKTGSSKARVYSNLLFDDLSNSKTEYSRAEIQELVTHHRRLQPKQQDGFDDSMTSDLDLNLVSIVLEPLENLQENCGLILPPNRPTYVPLQFDLISSKGLTSTLPPTFGTLFDCLHRAHQSVQSLYQEMSSTWPIAMTDPSLTKIQSTRAEFEQFLDDLRTELRKLLQKVKRGEMTSKDLIEVMDKKQTEGKFKADGNYAPLDDFAEEREKLDFLMRQHDLGMMKGVQYIGRGGNPDTVFESDGNEKPKYILYIEKVWALSGKEEWNRISRLFFVDLKGAENERVLVDCDFSPYWPNCDSLPSQVPSITEYFKGEFRTRDFVTQGQLEVKEQEGVRELFHRLNARVEQLSRDLNGRTDKLRDKIVHDVGTIKNDLELQGQRRVTDLDTVKALDMRVGQLNKEMGDETAKLRVEIKSEVKKIQTDVDHQGHLRVKDQETLKEWFNGLDKKVSNQGTDFNDKTFKIQSQLAGVQNSLKNDPVPVGFLYVQYPEGLDPNQLWPHLAWRDVSDTYANMFFRVIGSRAAGFGSTQEESSPRLSKVASQREYEFWGEDGYAERNISRGSWSPAVYTGSASGKDWSIKLYVSGDENRPVNMAIRIWKRTA